MRRFAHVPLAATAALSLSLAACGTGPETEEAGEAGSEYPLTVTDCGEALTIESRPQTVLTVGQSAVALLDAAGASDRIIARTGEWDVPLPEGLTDAAHDAEVLDPADPAAETIIGADPDIVVGYGLFEADPATLEGAGIPSLVVTGECNHDESTVGPITFDTVLGDIERFGEVFGTQEAADASIAALEAELTELEGTATGGGRTAAAVYYWSSSSDMSAYGGLSLAHDLLGRADLENVYGDQEAAFVPASFETLLDADPEVIVLAYGVYGETFEESREQFLSEPGTADLQAVRNDQIIGVPAMDMHPDQGAIRGLRTLLEGTAT
jgi:iron complex transport system substrate-binding protein